MNTPQIERQERTNSRTWRSLGLKVLAVAGIATAAWLMTGSAAQADSDVQSDENLVSAVESAATPIGGLLGTASNPNSTTGVVPVVHSVNTATQPVLGVTSDVLGNGSKSGRAHSGTTNQVVSTLANTTQNMVSAVVATPSDLGKGSLFSPLSPMVSPVTNSVRPLVGPLGGVDAGDLSPIGSRNSAANSGLSASPPWVQALFAHGGSSATRGLDSLEHSSSDRDLVMTARDATSPVSSRFPEPNSAPTGMGAGPLGSTGSLFGSHQDSGSFALVPVSVTSGNSNAGASPVTSFIGISRDSAADPMVSPD